MIGSELAERLQMVGLEATSFGDPAAAWQRLHDRYGVRATLLDRYALEAAARGVAVDELPAEVKERLTLEVLAAHAPGFEVVAGGGLQTSGDSNDDRTSSADAFSDA